jgi:hypothetical protein
MAGCGPVLALRIPCFSKPVYVQDRAGLTKHERKVLLRQAKGMADDFIEFGYDVYSKMLSDSFYQLYDLTIKHYLKIHEIQNQAISAGKPRKEVLAATDEYIESVVPK